MMTRVARDLEACRLALQEELDAKREAAVRNRMGQFATPTRLALDIQRFAKAHLGRADRIRFMDPAIGTGSFYSAFLDVFSPTNIAASVGYEVDPHYGEPADRLWRGTGLELRLEDFTKAETPTGPDKFDLLICNPPYVRHHHIHNREKQRLNLRVQAACGISISGLSGLYCYFLGLSHAWMAEGALAGWLIPSEFMDVNYGASVKRYLLDKVTLLHIHRFDPKDVQFGDALVSSAVVWLRNEPPQSGHEVRFTYGGTLARPKLERMVPAETLRRDPKWTRYPMKECHETSKGLVLGDFFKIKRGIVTGSNDFFILSESEIHQRGLPISAFRPILPSPRHLMDDEIVCENNGNPTLRMRLFLLDPPWNQDEIRKDYPKLWAYLDEGKNAGIADRYICRHRTPWYCQEQRPPAPFVCTYLGRIDNKRGKPFRFILNHSRATAANVYLMMYPKGLVENVLDDQPELKRRVWEFLNTIRPESILGEGCVYGGGLYKLEPKELGNVQADFLADILPEAARPREQIDLFNDSVK